MSSAKKRLAEQVDTILAAPDSFAVQPSVLWASVHLHNEAQVEAVRNSPGFVPVCQYHPSLPIMHGEIGCIRKTRYWA